MTMLADVSSRVEALRPLAPGVGPFPTPTFIDAVTTLRNEPVSVIGDHNGVMLISRLDDVVSMAGHPDLTDYHTPLGASLDAAARHLAELVAEGCRLDFDSLPIEAADPLVAGLEAVGLEPVCARHTVSAVLRLPGSFDEYLGMLSKKQRHEVRRKRRRYADTLGEVIHEAHPDADWAFEEFVRLHRLSAGDKGDFMTDERERFFRTLNDLPGWRVDLLRVPGTDRAAATLFSYSDDEAVYVYNSSYDPELGDASPGIAIVGTMIETAIDEGLARFDFLKGDEVYKFRLGAEERPLYRVEVNP